LGRKRKTITMSEEFRAPNFSVLMNQIQTERIRVDAYKDQLAVAVAERDEARSICRMFTDNYRDCPEFLKESIVKKYPWLKAEEKVS